MKNKKQENRTNILPFKKSHSFESDKDASEVARDLFSETWRAYLDQVSMAAIKLDSEPIVNDEEEIDAQTVKLKIV